MLFITLGIVDILEGHPGGGSLLAFTGIIGLLFMEEVES
jgi:hypothetical protein